MADVTSAGYAVDRSPTIPDGWLLFSALMILFTGIWNLFEGMFAFFRSTWFIGHTVGGALWIWALVWLGFGVLQVLAGTAIMGHRSWGRWFGIVTVGLITFIHLLNIGLYPWWSFVIIGMNIIVLFGLTVHWRNEASEY